MSVIRSETVDNFNFKLNSKISTKKKLKLMVFMKNMNQ